MTILDHYLRVFDEPVATLQLTAATCIYISCKLHETRNISAEVFVYSCSGVFEKGELLEKEKEVLLKIGFRVDFVDTYRILRELKKQFKFT